MKQKFLIIAIAIVVIIATIALCIVLKNNTKKPEPVIPDVPVDSGEVVEVNKKGFSDSIVLNIEDTEFKTEHRAYPTQIYLMDSHINPAPFYHDENGNEVKIPVYDCAEEKDERIEFDNGLAILYKNNQNLIVDNRKVDLNVDKEIANNTFYSYFCQNESQKEYKAYHTKIHKDSNNIEIAMNLYCPSSKKYMKFIVSKDYLIKAPVELGAQVAEDTYIYNLQTENYTLNEISEEVITFIYAKFKDDYFDVIYMLADGSKAVKNMEIKAMEFTLNQDVNIVPYEDDGKYNEGHGAGFINYALTRGNGEDVIEKGTKFLVITVLDETGNCIIKVENKGIVVLGKE